MLLVLADTGIWVKADCREEGFVSTKYLQPVLVKLLASGRSQGCDRGASSGLHLVDASGVHRGFPGLVVEALSFQPELGRDLLSLDLEV